MPLEFALAQSFYTFFSIESFYTSLKGAKGFYYPIMTPIINSQGILLGERCEYYSGLPLQAYKVSQKEMESYGLQNNIIWIHNDDHNRIRA
jgi:hypothetical protein